MNRRRSNSGFSLVEILAALLIFSVAIVGLTRAGTQSLTSMSMLEQKTFAGIVADNQLILARQRAVQAGHQRGRDQAAGYQFDWELQKLGTEVSGFYRLVVEVRPAGAEQVLIQRTAFTNGALP
jgi:general secretion pathway protein I